MKDRLRMKNKKHVILGAAVLVVFLGIAIKLIFFRSVFLYTGTIEATKIDISSRISSVISSLEVREGEQVKKLQVLLKLSCEDYRLNADFMRENFERSTVLFKQGSQPKEIFDQVKNRLQDAELKLSWCTVQSPLTGTVLNKYREPGEMVNPGTRLMTVANIKEPYAHVYVPQPLVAKLGFGMKVTGYLPELKMRPFEGQISWIGEQAEFTPKNVQTRDERTRLVYPVKVSFKNEEEVLKPGMAIEVRLPE